MSAVPPYQLFSAVAVLPSDLPHQRSLHSVTVQTRQSHPQ